MTFSIPSASRCSASSATAPVRAGTSHTLLTHLLARLLHPHAHLARVLGDIDRTHPLHHKLMLGVGNLLRFLLQLACPPITSARSNRVVARGPRSRGTEILTGVLEATVRDPSRSGPGTRLKYGLTHPRKRRRRRATRPHFHACEASPEGKQGAQIRRHTRVSKIRVRVAGTDSARVLGR